MTAAGMATFAAPLTAATLGAAREADQGVASGVNNVMGQLAGLLAIAILPAAAGLGQTTITGPEFAGGLARALLIVTGLAVAACDRRHHVPLGPGDGAPAFRAGEGPPGDGDLTGALVTGPPAFLQEEVRHLSRTSVARHNEASGADRLARGGRPTAAWEAKP